MCNSYSLTKGQAAIIALMRVEREHVLARPDVRFCDPLGHETLR
jgi:hypothetical protein